MVNRDCELLNICIDVTFTRVVPDPLSGPAVPLIVKPLDVAVATDIVVVGLYVDIADVTLKAIVEFPVWSALEYPVTLPLK